MAAAPQHVEQCTLHVVADRFAPSLARCEDFRLCRLTVGGVTAAVEAGFVVRDHYWSLIQSYDERHTTHGPGRLLMWRFSRLSAGRNLRGRLLSGRRKFPIKVLIILVQLGGLEPPTSCSTDRRSNQLSYNCISAGPEKGALELAGN